MKNVEDALNGAMPSNTVKNFGNNEASIIGQFVRMVTKLEKTTIGLHIFASLVNYKHFFFFYNFFLAKSESIH